MILHSVSKSVKYLEVLERLLKEVVKKWLYTLLSVISTYCAFKFPSFAWIFLSYILWVLSNPLECIENEANWVLQGNEDTSETILKYVLFAAANLRNGTNPVQKTNWLSSKYFHALYSKQQNHCSDRSLRTFRNHEMMKTCILDHCKKGLDLTSLSNSTE